MGTAEASSELRARPLAPAHAIAPAAAPRRAILGWILFDWACQPFFTLVTTFVFAPFFAATLAPDPITGQSLWGYATAFAGLALGFLSPVLGSIADASGPRKPWIVACGALLVVSSAALWFAEPGAGYAVGLALVAFAIGTVSVEIATVFNNAMMPTLVPSERLGRLSGAGWAMGYAGGLASLVIVLGFLAATPSGRTYFGIDPLFGLDPMLHEGDRAAGPFSALWFIAFVWPLLLFTPDAPRRGRPMRESVRQGLVQLRSTLLEARQRPDLVRFLAANMVYQDALVALFAFGGIYGAGVFGWTAVELGLFGILLTITGTIGALIGGRLDDRFGAKAIIVGAIVTLALVCLGVLSLGRDHVLFGIATPERSPEDGLFATIPEQVFVALGLVIGAVAGPLQASSRTFLARLVPSSEAGRYFGLLALSGKVTSFLAPLCVALATDVFETQAAAPAVLILFFAVGLMLLVRRT